MKRIFFIPILLLFLFGFFLWQEIYLPKDSNLTEEKLFLIEKGQNLFEIGENLEKAELIKNKEAFQIYVILIDCSGKLQAGTYSLSPSMSVSKIVKKLVLGDVAKEKITIIEGWNLRDIGFYFENKGMFQAEELWELAGFPAVDYSKAKDLPLPKDFSLNYSFLKDKPQNTGLEGYLFPDTYEVNKGAGIEEIITKTLENFDKKLTSQLREEIQKQNKSIFEIITMASLLEKEVVDLEDRKLVSGILWKRMENYIPLQVDCTITYITGKKTTKVSKEETQIDSSYNTYLYRDLPLGPICNPGIDSILASIFPETSDYWYYLSTPEGENIFSKILEEHNIAKAKYLK
ncbi:endolytic transglycosylase MltG [Patescibacteria group bacterium]